MCPTKTLFKTESKQWKSLKIWLGDFGIRQVLFHRDLFLPENFEVTKGQNEYLQIVLKSR